MRNLLDDIEYIKNHTIFSKETTEYLYNFLAYCEARSFTAEEFINEEYNWDECTLDEVMTMYNLQCRKTLSDICLALHHLEVYFVPIYNEKTILISKF